MAFLCPACVKEQISFGLLGVSTVITVYRSSQIVLDSHICWVKDSVAFRNGFTTGFLIKGTSQILGHKTMETYDATCILIDCISNLDGLKHVV